MFDRESQKSFSVNIIAFSHGCTSGWVSPFISYLKSDETHLTTGAVSSEDISWIGSLLCVGGFIGTIAFGKITQKWGKKNALFLLVIPHLSFWALIYFSTHVYHLYLARFLAGLTGGGSLRTISLYVAEISENRIRGQLGSFLMFGITSGMLLIFILGTFLDFFTTPLVILVLPTIFLVSVMFLHDTPTSLLSRNKCDKAFESLRFYRSDSGKVASEAVKNEFELLKRALENKNEEKLELKDFRKCRRDSLMDFIQLSARFSDEASEEGDANRNFPNFYQSIFRHACDHNVHG